MSYDASGDVVGINGLKPANPAQVIGSFLPIIPFKVSGAGAATDTDTITITFPALKTIHGWLVDAYVIASGSKVDDDAITVTVSGNVMTIVENGAGTIEADRYQGLVWGDAKLA